MNRIKRNIDIILIVAIGFIFRLVASVVHSYSNDELSAVTRLRFTNFSDLINQGVKTGDMHPAGVQLFMKGWSFIGGTAEGFMRFPFVLFGTASIWILFLIGKEWFNRKVGLFAAALLAVLYFPIMNAEFARPYSPGLLICLLIGFYIHKLLFQTEHKIKNALILGVLFALAMYTHYFSFLFAGFIGLSGLLFMNKTNWKPLVLSGLVGIFLFLPHVFVTYFHMTVGGLQWLAPPTYDWLFLFLFHAFNDSYIVVGGLIILFLIGIFSPKTESVDKRNIRLISIWFFGIFGVGFVLSYLATPVLKFPVMLFAFPYFLLLIGVVISRVKYFNVLLVCLMGLISVSTVVENKLFGNRHYALFKEVAIEILEWEKTYGAENIYTVYNINNPSYMNFYANQWGDTIHFDWDLLEFDSDIPLRKDVMEREEMYCILGFSSRLTLLQVFETIQEFYPIVVDSTLYNNGSVYLFKKGIKREEQGKVIGELNVENPSANWRMSKENVKIDVAGNTYYLLDNKTIYGPEFVFDLATLPIDKKNYLKIEVGAVFPDKEGALTVAFSAERNGEVLQYRGENFWMGHDLEDMIQSTENGIGYYAFEIPDFIHATDVLKISLWNRSEKETRINSFRIIEKPNNWN